MRKLPKINIEYSPFEEFKNSITNIDPVAFVENNLTLDGKPFRLNGNGYKPFADIYRYIGLKAVEPNAKPVILVKGRQVGATTMAAALECYFMACGLYGNHGRAPIRIMHLFPTLSLANAYTKQKLNSAISGAKPQPGAFKSNGQIKSFIEVKVDNSSPANNSMFFKQFIGDNQIWIESTGPDGDRVRGRTVDGAFFDECFPYDQYIETEKGKVKIGVLYDMWQAKKSLPKVKTYNEVTGEFEHKHVVNTWKREKRLLVKLITDIGEIKCTSNHRFLTDSSGWVMAAELSNKDFIKTTPLAIWQDYGFTSVRSVEQTTEEDYVYDIEVKDNHNFVVILGSRDSGGLIAHNCQDTPELAIGAVTKILTKSQWGKIGDGIQVFFGTPKRKGTNYHRMWQMSSQQYFHLGCESCEQHFPLYRPDVNWEDIWLYGFTVRCTECGHEQDKRDAAERGKWVSFNDEEDPKYVGYHINQLYIPDFTKETIIGYKPENNAINTERLYQNEVLGEFYDGEGGTISPDEIHAKCSDAGRRFTPSIDSREGRRVYAGFDWGQRGDWDMMSGRQRGQSYSCAVVLTAISPELFQIEFATRLNRTDRQSKFDVVEELFRRYSVHLGVGDIGDAFDLTHDLQRKYNERFLAARANTKVKGRIKYNKDIFPKEILFEKDYYYSELISLLKNGNIRFPYGSYEQIMWLVTHCCSMDIKITMTKGLDPVRRYVKGPTPNDGFVALLNAYLAYKWDITQGFKIKQPQFMKYDVARKRKQIPAVLGYVPRLK